MSFFPHKVATSRAPVSSGLAATLGFEILHMSANGDLAYWVGVQHANVQIEGTDDAVTLHLRITEMFRRENGDWKLIHRDADPHASSTDA